MKKTLIALTLAALPVASMAEVVLYGQIKGGVEVTKAKNTKGTITNIVDYGSRIGFKGKEQLSDNLHAIWQLEQKVDIAGGATNDRTGVNGFGTRNSFIGLEGSFGQVKAGYLHNPVGALNGDLDVWEYNSDAAGLGVFARGNDVVKRRVAVQYTTPDMGGFTAQAYVSPSDNNRKGGADANRADGEKGNKRIDRPVYGLGASYQQPGGGFFADAAATAVKRGDNNQELMGRETDPSKKVSAKHKYGYQALAQAGFRNDNLTAGLAYQYSQNVDGKIANGKLAATDAEKAASNQYLARFHEVAATAAYTINDAVTVKGSASYGFNAKVFNKTTNVLAKNKDFKYVQGVLGADYNLSKRTQLNSQVGYIQYGKKDNGKKDGVGTVGVGVKHKF
ncbi:porin [Conchiformibius steedae]|uniref:Porin n=1 Tax=Conchiformibius steedae TaxID=153493 RepID=A0A3P2A8J7_9NEIS|nr:porin [Conchiformibius steedae]RRD89933.1 porin [Conchiformibius steedae]